MSEVEPDLEAGLAAAPTKVAAKLEVGLNAGATAQAKAAATAKASAVTPRRTKVDDGTPRQQWDFVRKIYVIVLVQHSLTGSIVGITCFFPSIPLFFASSPHVAAYFALVVIALAPFITLWPMLKYREKHPANLLLFVLFTLCLSLSIGIMTSVFTTIGSGVLQFMILIGAAMINLIIYTLWAAMRQYQVTFYCPFLINHVLMILYYMLMQAYCPVGSFNVTFFGCSVAMMFALFIVYDIPLLIKHHSYDEHIFAVISLYPDLMPSRLLLSGTF